ncbi:uncharacterized protein LOC124942643 isoform X1 [Impatiens glandulifera]|uniref:uncharacterized protein LOC124942643 isoform X1 n=1 Tax=Impatiens glandulifera TaxID=253017 RepID=UPI001FB187A6|nr:uncharacterized protein LOC124942643 isoform X1 [Impatiens glandulifera]
MTYEDNHEDALVTGMNPNLQVDGNHLDYSKLIESIGDSETETRVDKVSYILRWAIAVPLVIILGVLVAVFVLWIGPLFMDKELIPWMDWQMQAFSKPMLTVILFASIAFFPVFLIPSSPSMWVVGMMFGYGFGFLVIICGVSIGMSLPFFLGSFFYSKIEVCFHFLHSFEHLSIFFYLIYSLIKEWLEKCPTKTVSLIRMAGEGDWFNQFQAVILIRFSPFPYILYNYCAVATNVKYTPYLLGSLVGIVPEIFVSIYTGILIRSLADASQGRHSMSTIEIVFNVFGFCGTVVTTIAVTVFVKSRLKTFREEEEKLLLN